MPFPNWRLVVPWFFGLLPVNWQREILSPNATCWYHTEVTSAYWWYSSFGVSELVGFKSKSCSSTIFMRGRKLPENSKKELPPPHSFLEHSQWKGKTKLIMSPAWRSIPSTTFYICYLLFFRLSAMFETYIKVLWTTVATWLPLWFFPGY